MNYVRANRRSAASDRPDQRKPPGMNETIRPDTLRPLPIRVAQRQYQRLVAHRAVDSLSIQEHVRRAIDEYLDNLDLKRLNQRLASAETSATNAESGGAGASGASRSAAADLLPLEDDPAAVGATPEQPPSAAAGAKPKKPSSTPGRAKASKPRGTHAEKKLVYR